MQKLAVITGAGSGIGRSLTEKLLARDYHVIAVGRRLEPLQELQQIAPNAVAIVSADVGTVAGRELIEKAVSKYAQLDCLVHNAALVAPFEDLLQVKLSDWQLMQRVNIEGPWFLTQTLLAKLVTGSRVLQIGSGASHAYIPEFPSYCVSKAALYGLYLNLKPELEILGIGLASVKPGIVDTPMQQAIRASEASIAGRFTQLKDNNRLVSCAQIGQFLAWLLCDTEVKEYSAAEWDIYDSSHHARWLGELAAPEFPWR